MKQFSSGDCWRRSGAVALIGLVCASAACGLTEARRLPPPKGIHIVATDEDDPQPDPDTPHRYVRTFGQAYSYSRSRYPLGFLLLEKKPTRIVFASVVITQDGYTVVGDFESCSLIRPGCILYSQTGKLKSVKSPSKDDVVNSLMLDAEAGSIRVFSQAKTLLAYTPW